MCFICSVAVPFACGAAVWLWPCMPLPLGGRALQAPQAPRHATSASQPAPPPACPSPLSLCAGESWLFSRDGRSYRAAAAHFAHLLVERNWGLTPAGSGFERLALAAFEAGGAPAAPQPQWQQCLAHTCSVSSVGCGRSE